MSSSKKSKVLSVRLSLETLQSCFDLCEALQSPASGASSAISQSLTLLMRDLRAKGTLPTYRPSELETLLSSMIARKNPTSMISLENLSNLDRSITDADFAPSLYAPKACEIHPVSEIPRALEGSLEDQLSEQEEYADLIEQSIREQQTQEADDLLSKLII